MKMTSLSSATLANLNNVSLKSLYNNKHNIYVVTNNPDAIIPKRLKETNCSFHIPITSRTENRIDDQLQGFNDFSTDLAFIVPIDFYLEINGTDELCNRGYMLPHPKIVEPDNRGIIRIKLIKQIDSEDLPVPYLNGLVGVLRNCNYAHIKKQNIDPEPLSKVQDKYHEINTKNSIVNKIEQSQRGAKFFQ
jgi:hypothetical protein